jgi:sulfur carrier protein ThiS
MNNPKFNEAEFKQKLIKGLDLTFKKLLAAKRLTDGTFVFSQNGKIVKIKARDIKD